MQTFKICPDIGPMPGRLFYRDRDEAFDYEYEVVASTEHQRRWMSSERACLIVHSLQIEVAIEESMLLYVWGYHLRWSWKPGTLSPPAMSPGSLRYQSSRQLTPGVGDEMRGTDAWITTYDRNNGWVHVGDPLVTPEEVVMFADGTGAGLKSDALCGLWLSPTFVIDLPDTPREHNH